MDQPLADVPCGHMPVQTAAVDSYRVSLRQLTVPDL